MTELSPFMSGIMGILIGSGILAIVISLWLRSKQDEVKTVKEDARAAREEVVDLRDRTVHDLAVQLQEHIKADKSQTYGAKLDQMAGQLNKMDGKLDRIAETTSNQAAKIEANASYIGNLDRSFQRHKEVAHRG